MYKWFWCFLDAIGISVRADGLDMADVNPFDIPWRQARWSFSLFGRKDDDNG